MLTLSGGVQVWPTCRYRIKQMKTDKFVSFEVTEASTGMIADTERLSFSVPVVYRPGTTVQITMTISLISLYQWLYYILDLV